MTYCLFFCFPGEYFSEAKNDSIFVWEDESLAFDVLSNDYVAGKNSNIIEFSIVRFHITNCSYISKSLIYSYSDINSLVFLDYESKSWV